MTISEISMTREFPWKSQPLGSRVLLTDANEFPIAQFYSQAELDIALKACNSYRDNLQRIEQLEAALRDEISALAHWRGNGRASERLPQTMCDAMALRLTELRRVVEVGK